MLRTASLLALATLALLGCKKKEKQPADDPRAVAADPVVDVPDDDAAMNQAIAEARAHVQVFADELATAPAGKIFSVKKPFPHGDDGHEHMWLVDVKAIDGGFDGRLDNEPRDARDAKVGERYQVSRAELSDWLISDDQGRIWGGYTLRVLLPTMLPEDRAAFEQALQPLPGDDPPAADAGKRAVGELKKRLVGALTEALKQGAPAAIAACNTEAPAIAAAISADGVTAGRATRKPRNPANLASGWQADALAQFEGLVEAGTSLDGASFSRTLPDGRHAYAEPLVIQSMCVACHGEAIDPAVSTALADKYPGDQATGYAVGDLRGVAWAVR